MPQICPSDSRGGIRAPTAVDMAPGARVLALAGERLRAAPYRQLRHLSCETHEGVLTLRGRVSTYYLKQLAQALVRTVDGVEEIANHVQVIDPPSNPPPGTSP